MARRRKKYIEPPENSDRWMVSYADFVTLLFAFFVVMYSISSVNVGKYRVLSESMSEAFEHKKTKPPADSVLNSSGNSPRPIQVGDQPTTTVQPIKLEHFITDDERRDADVSEELKAERRKLEQIAGTFKAVLEPFIEKELVEVKKTDLWVEIEIKSGMLFESGEAALRLKASLILRKISEVLKRTTNVIRVEGHTDNVPIDTIEFPSNWDLSAARAASVVRELIDSGIDPARLVAVGYGEYHPIADNKSGEGRFKNRRVSLVLISRSLARYGVKENERLKLLKD
jgi:chemotaxis protein MotB